MTYGITGASGQLARLVADALLASVPAADLVLVTRDPSKLEDYAGRGVTVRQGDFADPASLSAAFAGVDRLLIVSTDQVGTRLEGQKAAIDAAVAAGVGRIAYTSVTAPSDSNPEFVVPDHLATEIHLFASGVEYTILRNAIYTEMYLGSAPGAIASGTLLTNNGDGRQVTVSRLDCAEAAAAALTGDEHADKVYEITGTEPLDADALAALYAELSGKPVTVEQVDDAAYAQALAPHLPSGFADAYATLGAAVRLGFMGVVSGAVADLTGHAPRTVREILAPALAGDDSTVVAG
jgi:NAD(P)H dehydrogenase (quinone)